MNVYCPPPPPMLACVKLALYILACESLTVLFALAPSGVLCKHRGADRCFSGVCGAQGAG